MIRITKGLMIAALFLCAASISAQNLKFGHVNTQDLYMAMPEKDSAEVKFKKHVTELQDQAENLQVEFNKKNQDYMKDKATLTPAMKEFKEKELGDLQQRLQDFQQTAQQELQLMNEESQQKILEKISTATKKVAKANGFTYVFNISSGAVMYFSDQSIDVTPMVKKELGISEIGTSKK